MLLFININVLFNLLIFIKLNYFFYFITIFYILFINKNFKSLYLYLS